MKRKILYGYIIEQGKPEIQRGEEQIVKHVFKLRKSQMSLQCIADNLNKEGIEYACDGSKWDKHKIKRMLDDLSYLGLNG